MIKIAFVNTYQSHGNKQLPEAHHPYMADTLKPSNKQTVKNTNKNADYQ